jgi:hypothetical protein
MTVPVVIVRPPDNLGPIELAVHHREWGVEVDVRTAGTSHSWTPLEMVGGTFETRSA